MAILALPGPGLTAHNGDYVASLAAIGKKRNDWLTAAGFAPIFKARPLDHPQMTQVMSAVRMMLTSHAPFPAAAIDRAWNIRMANAPFDMMTTMLGADLWQRIGGPQRNLMRLFFHPKGIKG